MAASILNAAWRTKSLVGRQSELETIFDAVYQADPTKLEIVLILGSGGLGKSRLLEEALWRGGNSAARREYGPIPTEQEKEWDWTRHGAAVFSNIVDLNDGRLHAPGAFMHALVAALEAALEGAESAPFRRYHDAYRKLSHADEMGMGYASLQRIREDISKAFLQEMNEQSENKRVVWAVDTAEQLANFSSSWLLSKELLAPPELGVLTQQWLKGIAEKRELRNVTLLLAGRDVQGRDFFNAIQEIAARVPDYCVVRPVKPRPFTREETRTYFSTLANDWAQGSIASGEDRAEWASRAASMTELASDDDQVGVIHLYTDGQPVRLALYTDLLIEAREIPAPLRETEAEAQVRLGESGALEAAQAEIESQFIDLLFGVGGGALHSEILKALIRARRGLSAKQLYYVLESRDWPEGLPEPDENDERFVEIKTQLDKLRQLSIFRPRPDQRFGLQDEMYSIYAKRVAADFDNHQEEMTQRERLYKLLRTMAERERTPYEKEWQAIREEDERQLRIESPAKALSAKFPRISESDEAGRIEIRNAIRDWKLEELHYALLLDPRKALNDIYFDAAQNYWLATDAESEAVTHAELWRVLNDPWAMQFVKFDEDPDAKERGETPQAILKRVADQADVIRWLRGFVLHQAYARAVAFCDQVQARADQLTDTNEHHSWNHTFARGERACWREYAIILRGERWSEVKDAVQRLQVVVNDLEKLARTPRTKMAFPERQEKGFKGHPAELQLNRNISLIYNYIGYGYTVADKFRSAVTSYGKSLRYLRETRSRPQEATTRNNLARALAELGRGRGRRVAVDGYLLRREIGDEVPLAYSLNTLALVDNDMGRPEVAYLEAACALAYFRRADDHRGMSLALLQLGEALRRLAGQYHAQLLPMGGDIDSPEDILDEAERALNEAFDIFTKTEAKAESVRMIEADIEMGCIHRDHLQSSGSRPPDGRNGVGAGRPAGANRRHYHSALDHLNAAVSRAHNAGFQRLYLDALGNIAWTHYKAGEPEKASVALDELQAAIPVTHQIRAGKRLPKSKVEDAFIYHQLSKASSLRGRISMEAFIQRAEELDAPPNASEKDILRARKRIHSDEKAKALLQQAAETYVLGIAYAQLLSPRAHALPVIYDSLYEYLKGFSRVKLRDFYQAGTAARKKYGVRAIRYEDLGNMDLWLEQLFGDYLSHSAAGLR